MMILFNLGADFALSIFVFQVLINFIRQAMWQDLMGIIDLAIINFYFKPSCLCEFAPISSNLRAKTLCAYCKI
jgi:hypothetical protein